MVLELWPVKLGNDSSTFLYRSEAKIQAIDPSCLPPKCSGKNNGYAHLIVCICIYIYIYEKNLNPDYSKTRRGGQHLSLVVLFSCFCCVLAYARR